MTSLSHSRSSRVFLSHAWVDQTPIRTNEVPARGLASVLRDRLVDVGVSVFYDANELEDFDEIEQRVLTGLRDATVFICWYSDAYRMSRACNWELTTALAFDPTRVLVINPESGFGHIRPASLRSQRIASVPAVTDTERWKTLVNRIVARCESVTGTFGAILEGDATPWFGDPPARFDRWVGRTDELWALDDLMRSLPPVAGGVGPPSAVVVHGIGGAGKTALAYEYARLFARAYPGGVFWMRASAPQAASDQELATELQRTSQLLMIARQLDPPPESDPNGSSRDLAAANDVIRRRTSDPSRPYLWVIDDIKGGLSASDLKRWLPPTPHGRVLVTTQATTYRQFPNIRLDEMTADEGVELLLSAHGRPGEVDLSAARELCARLGHLPLALEVVGALASLPGCSVTSLLAELADPLVLAEVAAANSYASMSPTEHELSVMATFAPGIRRLDPGSFWLLATAAALNVAPLPVSVLGPTMAEVAPQHVEFRAALGDLLSRSLVRTIDGSTVELHALVGGASLRLVPDRTSFVDGCTSMAAAVIADALGDEFDLRRHGEGRRAARLGYGLVARTPFTDAAREFDLLRSLGRHLHVDRRFVEAAELEQRGFDLARRTFGEGDPRTLTVGVNLAINLERTGHVERAVATLGECIRRLEGRFGELDRNTLTAKHNLANMLFASDPVEARRLGLETYDARLRAFGPDDEHTLYSLHSLVSNGVVPPAFADAASAYESLIATRTRVLGFDNHTTQTSVSNYIQRLLVLGQPETAVQWARRLVAAGEAMFGRGHPATLPARATLLGALSAAPSTEAAEVEEIAGQLALESPAGSINGRSAQDLSNAGEHLRRSGRPALAVSVLRAARQLAVSESDALLIEHNLAAAVAAAGDPAAALASFRALVPRMETVLGNEHRITYRARRQQAVLSAQLGAGEDSLERQLELLHHWESRAGRSSPEVGEALEDIVVTLRTLGRVSEAETYRAQRAEIAADSADARHF